MELLDGASYSAVNSGLSGNSLKQVAKDTLVGGIATPFTVLTIVFAAFLAVFTTVLTTFFAVLTIFLPTLLTAFAAFLAVLLILLHNECPVGSL